MNKFLRLATVLFVFATVALVVNAQTLEEVTDDSASYYSQQVTLEGVVQDFISPYVFVLGEDTFLDNDQILVINRSGNVFAPNIYEEARINVSGTIHPSRNAWENGDTVDGFEVDSNVGTDGNWGDIHDNMDMNAEDANTAADAEEMTDADIDMSNNFGTFNVDTTSLYYNGYLPDDYDNYTILVVTDMNTVSLLNANNNE